MPAGTFDVPRLPLSRGFSPLTDGPGSPSGSAPIVPVQFTVPSNSNAACTIGRAPLFALGGVDIFY